MAIILTPTDFEQVGQLAAHIDEKKLQIAVREAVLFDMERIFCDFWFDVEKNWESAEQKWKDLINGSTYLGCGDKQRRHLGIKNMLVYFAYARYVPLNGFNDTPNGHVSKSNPFSVPKPLKELHQFSDKYRNMALDIKNGIDNFLCLADKETYPNFNRGECQRCGCAGECDSSDNNTKGFGIKSNTVSKWDA